jgi:DNA polymerase III alpha subunit
MLFPHLVFERFIDITREDLPDIDLDFESCPTR